MAGNVAGIVTGRKGPCLYHSLRDGRTCSIFLVPVEILIFIFTMFWEMRFIHILETIGSATGSATTKNKSISSATDMFARTRVIHN